MAPVYLFGGSRFLSEPGLRLVRVLGRLAASGVASWHVGDALGADSAFVNGFVSYNLEHGLPRENQRLTVFSVEPGERLRPASLLAVGSGVPVALPPRESLKIPYRAQLVKRSETAAAGVTGAWFVAEHPDSKGTFNTASFVAAAGGVVHVFPLFHPDFLNPLNLKNDIGYWHIGDFFGVPCATWTQGIPF